MASIVGYLGSAFSSTSGSLALGDQVWNDKNLYDLKKEVEHVLENENENENQLHIKEQLPPFFIEKSLRQGSGDVKHSVLVCKRFLDFRKREKWPIILNIKDINMEALKSGMHWLFGDRYGRAVFVFNPEHLDTKVCSIAEFQKMGMYLMEQVIQSEQVQRYGVAIIFDCRRIHVSTIFSMISFHDAKRGTEMWQDAFPCKLRSIIVVGLSIATSSFISLFLKVLPKKLRNRVSFKTMEETAIEIGIENLPPSMFGELKLNLNQLNIRNNHVGEGSVVDNVDSSGGSGSSSSSSGSGSNNSVDRTLDITVEESEDKFLDVEIDNDIYENASGGDEIIYENLVPSDVLEKLAEIEREKNIKTIHQSASEQQTVNKSIGDVNDDDEAWNWNTIVNHHIKYHSQLFELKPPPM